LTQNDLTGIIKRLNKPEMLLLNHLQNQIKNYYPQKMNKYLLMDQNKSESPSRQEAGKSQTLPVTLTNSQ
jgi:hypothetical protein